MQQKDLAKFYETRLVERWHNRPDIKSQTTGDHSFGMLLLLLTLHPNPSSALMQAIIRHDLSEIKSGDFPSDVKRRFPVASEIDEFYQKEFAEEWGLTALDLSEQDKIWLKFLDQLEPLYYLNSLPFKSERTIETMRRLSESSGQLANQLRAFGYLMEPDETVH